MNIDILVFEGSTVGVTSKSLWGDAHRVGLGGSETAMITMCEEWHRRGDTVVLYNDPYELYASPFEQLPIASFNPQADRDVLIVFRSVHHAAIKAKGYKVWWSCDQYLSKYFTEFAPKINKSVCNSERHKQCLADIGVSNAEVIDLPVRVQDFDGITQYRLHDRLVFSSVPARGLDNVFRMWPTITQVLPNVSLVVTSDYRLWGCPPSDGDFRQYGKRYRNIHYRGALPRKDYLTELLNASVVFYPCNYDEMFCVSLAEAQVAGCYPITSSIGALATTNMGTSIPGQVEDHTHDDWYVSALVNALTNPEFDEIRMEIQNKAIQRFDPKRIVAEWDTEVFSGG